MHEPIAAKAANTGSISDSNSFLDHCLLLGPTDYLLQTEMQENAAYWDQDQEPVYVEIRDPGTETGDEVHVPNRRPTLRDVLNVFRWRLRPQTVRT